MFDVDASLVRAMNAARERLAATAAHAARAQTALGAPSADGEMAEVARGAIFEEALLNAVHARLAELKAVSK